MSAPINLSMFFYTYDETFYIICVLPYFNQILYVLLNVKTKGFFLFYLFVDKMKILMKTLYFSLFQPFSKEKKFKF